MTNLFPYDRVHPDGLPVGYAFHPATGQEIRSWKECDLALGMPRHIGHTQLRWDEDKEVVVSTVHLVVDHGFGMSGGPALWESMMFGDLDAIPSTDDLADFQVRYQSEDAARAGHVVIVRTVTNNVVNVGFAVTTRELTESLLRRELTT